MTAAWRRVEASAVLAVHDRRIAEHGGADGMRDRGAIGPALARPRNRAAHGEPDAADRAATHIHGLAAGRIGEAALAGWIRARPRG